MSKRFLSGINVTGTATFNTAVNAGVDTDKFLVLDAAGNVDFRTGDELRLDIGADVVSKVQHEVKLGETMTIGTPVYIGVDLNAGTNMTVYKATNATEAGSSKTIGLIDSSGITNDLVQVVTEGLLAGLNTSTATKGDPVWLGVNGALLFGLANKPVAPAHMVFLGIVTRVQQNNGEIFVKVQNGFEMKELHNYAEGSVQNNEVIVYESATSLYKPKSIPTILGYTPVTNARTLTINGTTYDLSADRSWTISANLNARTEYEFTTDGTTATYSAVYSVGQVDVFYNGSKLSSTEFTATNGTSVTLGFTPPSGQLVEVVAWETGGGVSSGRTLTINGVSYDLSADRSWTVTDSSKLPLSGGTLTGNLNGTTATFSSDVFALMGVFTRNSADTFIGSSNNTSGMTVNGSTLVTKIISGGDVVATFANGGAATFTNRITSNRLYGTYSSVLNTYATVNPSSNVLLMSSPNDRDAWIYLDQADTGTNWGIYHRQIDSAVGLLEANSIAYIGGGNSSLKAFIGLQTGNAYFSGNLRATSTGVDGTFADAFVGVYNNNSNETNSIQTAVSSDAGLSGFRFQVSNGGGSTGRTNVLDLLRSKSVFYTGVGIGTSSIGAYILAVDYNASAAAVMSIKNSSSSGYSGAHILNNSGQVMGHWGYANGSTGAPLTDTIYFGSTASKSVVFTTADTIRMSINPSGYVTRPFQPAFMAYSSGVTVNAGYWQIISNSITTEAYDIGSNYSGGRFTAPVAGRYYFFFGGWSNIASNGDRYGISFVVNSGSTYYIAGGNYCNVDSPLAGASIVHNLVAGDYVELHIFTSVGGTWGGGHGVWWGGYLL